MLELLERHEVVSRPEYRAELEVFGDDSGRQMCMMHIDFEPSKFSKASYARLLEDWKLFRSVTDAPLYGHEPNPDDKKWEHFVSALGFKNTHSRIDCIDGQSRRLFVSLPDRTSNDANEQFAEHVAD